MLPISNVDGGDNPADPMTKTVGIGLAKKHMKTIGIRFAEGRSEAVAKLHSIVENHDRKVEQKSSYLNILKTHKVPRT